MAPITNYTAHQNWFSKYNKPISRRSAIAIPLAVAASALLPQKPVRESTGNFFGSLAEHARNAYNEFNQEPTNSFTAHRKGNYMFVEYNDRSNDRFFVVAPLAQDPGMGTEHLAKKANPDYTRTDTVIVGKLVQQLINYESVLSSMQDGETRTFIFAKTNVKTHPDMQYPVGHEIKNAKSLDEAVRAIIKND